MSEIKIYVEGGGGNKALRNRCSEGFHKLLEKSGFVGRVPRIVACGSRNDAYDDFKTAHTQGNMSYVALLVDSEDPVADIEKTWEHLKTRPDDGWIRPTKATDDQVFLMTTCMETWIVADRASLKQHYGKCLQESALPAITDLEMRDKHSVQDCLMHATKPCEKNAYAKGEHSFKVLATVDPAALTKALPSFVRMRRILDAKLP